MKNPKFAHFAFSSTEVLTADQQRKVVGGDGGYPTGTSPNSTGSLPGITPPSYPPGNGAGATGGGGYPTNNPGAPCAKSDYERRNNPTWWPC